MSLTGVQAYKEFYFDDYNMKWNKQDELKQTHDYLFWDNPLN